MNESSGEHMRQASQGLEKDDSGDALAKSSDHHIVEQRSATDEFKEEIRRMKNWFVLEEKVYTVIRAYPETTPYVWVLQELADCELAFSQRPLTWFVACLQCTQPTRGDVLD
jgi:hypothetical protein